MVPFISRIPGSFRRTASNIAQILLVFIIIPIICTLIGKFSGDGEDGRLFLDIIGEVPYVKLFANVLSVYSQYHASALVDNSGAYLQNITQILNSIESSMFQLLNVTLCVALFNILWSILQNAKLVRGDCIFFTALGVFVGYIVVGLYPVPLVASAFLMLLYIVIDMIFVQSIYIKKQTLILKYIMSSLKFGVEMISTLCVTGIVVLILVAVYCGGAIGSILLLSLGFAIPFLAVILVKALCFKQKP